MTFRLLVAVVLLFLTLQVSGRIFDTDLDSVVTEASAADDDAVTVDAAADVTSKRQEVGYSERSCYTFDNKRGYCRTVQECYKLTKLHQQISNLETWILGTRGTCNYVEPTGRQIYGVCCQFPSERATNRTERLLQGRNGDTQERIIGGVPSQFGEWPFMAGIFHKNRLFCGGSLIDSRHVLTAAHCVSKFTPDDVAQLEVLLGALYRSNGGIRVRVRSITRHKSFDPVHLHYDIALITLATPVSFSNGLSPVCIYNERFASENYGKQATVLGWGNLEPGSYYRPEVLHKATLQIKTLDECRRNFGSSAPGGIRDHFICAHAPGRDACSGDSGGPLMINNCQVGIVSWGIGCATHNYGVYTRIASFKTWIDRNRIKF